MERRKVSNAKNGGTVRRFVIGGKTPHEVYRYFISYIYPNICPFCEEIIDYDEDCCDRCRNKLVMFDGDFSVKCADKFTAYCLYVGQVRNAIRKFKYEPRGNSYYAFGFGIVQALHRNQLASEIDAVTYIPMTKIDRRKRGYNQTELIAKEIHHFLDIPCIDVLEKTRQTKSQKSLKENERHENVAGAFAFKNSKFDIKDKCILVIDDLCTSGSTLSEAARVIKSAGAASVIAASFAKTKSN